MATTPKELASRIGVSPKRVRQVLRELYRPNGESKHARWLLDDEMVAAATRELHGKMRG